MSLRKFEICDTSHWSGCLVGRLGRGQEGATRFRCSCSNKPADLHRRSRAMLEGVRTFTVQLESGTALGRSGLRNWSERTLTFVCAVSEVIRNMKTCSCLQWRLIRSNLIIEEAADDLIMIVEDDSCTSVALLRRARGFHLTRSLRRRL